MSPIARALLLSTIGAALTFACYLGWQALAPPTLAKLPQAAEDDAVVMEVLEGVFEAPPTPPPPSQAHPQRSKSDSEEILRSLEQVAGRHGIEVQVLRDRVRDWTLQVKAQPVKDDYAMALAYVHGREYANAEASAAKAFRQAMQRPNGGARILARRAMALRGFSLMALGQNDAALAAYEKTITLTDPRTEKWLWARGKEACCVILQRLNRLPEAEMMVLAAIEVRSLPEFADPHLCTLLTCAGKLAAGNQRLPEACKALRECLRRAEGFEPASVAASRLEALMELGKLETALGRPADAIACLQEALALLEQGVTVPKDEAGEAAYDMAFAYTVLKQTELAEQWMRKSVEYYQRAGPPGLHCKSLCAHSKILVDRRQFVEAEAEAKSALTIGTATSTDPLWHLGDTYAALGYVYLMAKKIDQAEPVVREALRLMETKYGPDHEKVAPQLFHLALIYSAQKRFTDAESLWWDLVSMGFRTAATSNTVPPDLVPHIRSFVSVMELRGVPSAEGKLRLRQMAQEVRMSDALFRQIVNALAESLAAKR